MSRAQDFLDYLDSPLGADFTLAPEEAMAYFAAKGLRTTFDWRDMVGADHVASFTVAKMMDTDLLADVHDSLLEAMATGKPFRQWADEITPLLQARGWWGRKAVTDPLTGRTIVAQLGSPGRLQTIYRTNMQTAYAAGAWAQMQDQAEVAPFLLYDAIDDHRTRPEHAAWDGQVHAIDSPFWKAHYPPNGWNCRCGVIQLSEDDLAAMGMEVSPPVKDKAYNWTNPRTGKTERIPEGLDPGWNYNPGADYAKHLTETAIAKARGLPPQLTTPAVKGITAAEQAALESLDAEVKAGQLALAKAMGAEQLKRSTMKAGERSAKWQLDQALTNKTPYLAKAIGDLTKTKAGQGMAASELLATAQAKAAQAKASANLSSWKAAYTADKAPSPAAQAAFDALPDDAQGALLQQLDGIKADKALQAAATAELDNILVNLPAGGLENKALAKLMGGDGFKAMKPAEVLAAVQAEVAGQKAALSKAVTLGGLKKSLIAGKVPTPAQASLLEELTPDAKAKLLADVDATKTAAMAKAAPQGIADKAPQVLAEADMPLDTSTLVQIGPQKGSNPGGLYQDQETGAKWYIKRPGNPEQARNEVLAGQLYRAAGIDTPELRLTAHQGQVAIASRIVDGLETGTAAQLAAAGGSVEGFVMDAWLGNWDVVGLGFDNLLLKGGRAFRVDTGGALRFRAQGGLKGSAFGDEVLELDTLRNAATNRQSAAVFGKATQSQLEDGARLVLAIPPERIRQLVEEFGPLDRGERDKLLATLMARRENLAQRFPNARPKAEAPAPVTTGERVTEFEQREIEASRANGYTLATDGGDIEDHHVVAMTFKDAKGVAHTRLSLKLRPEAAARLQAELPGAAGQAVVADFTATKAKGLELMKGINSQAAKGLEIRADKELLRYTQFKAELGKVKNAVAMEMERLADAPGVASAMVMLVRLEAQLDDYFARIKPGGKAESLDPFDFGKVMNQALAAAADAKQGATAWVKQEGLDFGRASIKAGRVVEDGSTVSARVASSVYRAEFEGGRVMFVPDTMDNSTGIRGYAQLEVQGTGVAATAKAMEELRRLGVDTSRASPESRVELYLDRHLYLRSTKSTQLEKEWLAITKEGSQADRIERKLALLNREAGFDVRSSPNWDPEGTRQAFGHGRITMQRADLIPEEVAKFNAEHVIFHNPAGLGWSGGAGVLDRFKLLVEAGGQLASQVDRIRRGVPLVGSSVGPDFQSGGANYVFTRLSAKGGHIREHGAGFILKPQVAQRLDAFSYSGDRYGTVDRDIQRSDRAADLDGMRRNARASGNETNFRDSVSLFDAVEHIVLDTIAQATEARKFMQANGYATWTDGRPLSEVIIAKTHSPYRK